jgi:drug/metabolite transporter (DMT)-like permease
MFHAAEFVSPGLATVIANVQPIVAAVLAYVFLGERLKATGRIGLAVGLAGIAVIAWPGLAGDSARGYSQGIAYVLLAATGVSIGNVAIKRLTGQADPIMAMGFQLLIGAAPLALLSMLTEDVSLLAWSPEFILVLVALAVLGSSLAFWLWFEVLEQVTLNRANAFTFLVAGLRADDWRGLLRRTARGSPGRGCRPGADRYLAGAAARRFILTAPA